MTVLVFIGALLAAMAIGMPIAYALILTGVALMLQLGLFDSQILAQNLVGGVDGFTLLAVPFFMLAGEVMNTGGLSKRIVALALTLVGHQRGGLGYVAIMAACVLSALSGSAVADAAALSALLVPMMVKAGHDKARSAGLVASASVIGPIIPPSIAFILFGVTSGLSISKLFLAGIVPGLMIGLALAIAWWIVVRKENVTPRARSSAAERWKAFKESLWALGLPVIIIVGLKFGIFTPTEAAVVAAVYSLLVATCIYRELKVFQLFDVFLSAAKVTSVVIFLVAAALVTGWLISIADLPGQVVQLLDPFMESPILLMLVIMALVMVVGTAMDMAPTILILTPVLVPVVKAAGIDPIYFGVLFIINNSIGLITPPVGTVLNVVAGVSGIRMETVIRGVSPFLVAQLLVLLLMILFPSLVTVPAAILSGR